MLFARSDGRGARPAARAARQGARLDVNGKPVEVLAADALSGAVDDLQLGHDAKRRKIFALQLRERALGGLGHIQRHARVERLADELFRAGQLERLVHVGAHAHDLAPVRFLFLGERESLVRLRHVVERYGARVLVLAVRHGEPDLVGGEAEHRREQAGHRVEHPVDRGLGAAAGETLAAVAVEAVLDDVEIEVRHFHHAEVVDGVGGGVELVAVVSGADAPDEILQTADRPFVERQHVRKGDAIGGVEPVQIAENVARGVADLEVLVGELLEDVV